MKKRIVPKEMDQQMWLFQIENLKNVLSEKCKSSGLEISYQIHCLTDVLNKLKIKQNEEIDLNFPDLPEVENTQFDVDMEDIKAFKKRFTN